MPKPSQSPIFPICIRHVTNLSFSSSSPPSLPPSTSPSSLPPLTADDEAVVSSAVSILRHHRSKRRWTLLKSLHPPAALSTAELAHILHRLRNHPRLALRLFLLSTTTTTSSSVDRRRRDDPLAFAAIAHVLARHRLRSAALDVLDSAVRSLDPSSACASVDEDGDRPPEIFRSLANTYRDFDSAPFVFDLLARAYLRSKRLDRALQIVRALRSRRIQPLVGTANALILLASRTKGSDAGLDLYKEIFRSEPGDIAGVKVPPNAGTFNTLLHALYREGNLERAKQIRVEMESFGCEPNVFTYSVLMAGFCDEGMVDKAAELFEEMVHRGIPPDAMAFNTLIRGYCEAGEVERAEELYRKMILSEVEPTETTFQHLVRGHCKVGDVDAGLLLYRDMKRRGYRMEVVAVDELLEEMCRKGRIREGLKVLRDEKKREGFAPTRRSYEVLIRGFCEQGEMDDALKVQAEMAGKGYLNSLEVYSAFVRGYEEKGDTEKVRKLKDEMLQMCADRGESNSYE